MGRKGRIEKGEWGSEEREGRSVKEGEREEGREDAKEEI